MKPCKCGKCGLGEPEEPGLFPIGGDGSTIHTPIVCVASDHPMYPLLESLEMLTHHPTHRLAQSMKKGPVHGNLFRLEILEKSVCLTCGQPQGSCEHPRVHPRREWQQLDEGGWVLAPVRGSKGTG